MPRKKKETLKRRKDGRYRCVWQGMAFYSSESAEDALRKRDEYRRMTEQGFSRQTVTEYTMSWIKRAFPSVSPSTYRGNIIHLQHLVDCIGDKLLLDVLPSDIKQVYSDKYAAASASYIAKAKQLYCALFDAALSDRLITFNPARDRSAKPHRGSAAKTRILTKQQRIWIETLCHDHRAFTAVMAMLYAGLRPQETKALIIERDVDFDAGIITIHQTAHLDGRRYACNAVGKSANANRRVPLLEPLRAVLEGKTGYLISSANGEPVTQSSWRTVWQSYIHCMETAINGMPHRWYGKTREHRTIIASGGTLPPWVSFDIVPYTLRHGFCAFCRDAGVEINTCRRWMGHADAQLILRVYDSVSESREEAERKKVENRTNQGQKEGQKISDPSQTIDS